MKWLHLIKLILMINGLLKRDVGEANVEQEQPTKAEQPFHNVDNLIFDSNVEDPLSSGEKFDEDDRDLVLCFI